MKPWFITLVLVGSSFIHAGCGKNKGRTSGQNSGIQTVSAPAKQVLKLENSLGKRPAPLLPGYRILGVVATETLPTPLRILDSGAAIGNLNVEFEVRRYSSAYSGDIGEPELASESVPTGFRVFLFTSPQDATQSLLVAQSGQPDDAFLFAAEAVNIPYKVAYKCSQVYVPRRDRDHIPDQVSRCDYKTEICYVKHVTPFIGHVIETEEAKLIWHIEHDYPGSRCTERKPDFTQVAERKNTRQASRIRVELYRSLLTPEATELEMKL